MRRGALADHDVPRVLRTAAAERLNGQIDFDGGRPASVYLESGAVALVCWQDEADAFDVHESAGHALDGPALRRVEDQALRGSIAVLCDLVGRREGSYYHQPFGDHPAAGLWAWDVDDLLVGTAAHAAERAQAQATLAARTTPVPSVPAERPAEAVLPDAGSWRLGPRPPAGAVDAEAWLLLAALAGTATRAEVVARSGLPAEQVEALLVRMVAEGILVPDAGPAAAGMMGGRVRSRRDQRRSWSERRASGAG